MPIWKDASYFDSPSKIISNDEPSNKSHENDESKDASSPKEVNTNEQQVNTVSPEVNIVVSLVNIAHPKDMLAAIPTTPNTRIHKDHPLENVIGNVQSSIQIREMKESTSEQGLKWIFKNKPDERGIVIRNKARLVAQGHTQEEGIDFDDSAFLYGTIIEEVYVCQPPGFEDPDYLDKVYKMVKALYGLHQALRAWYETLAKYLLDNGFHRGRIDP
ncbi:putative ribonuclease H-like domain-containing protein, partial [Tanacetum coccineum]